MVDEITRLGELLKLPDLEEETKALINAKMREMIGETKVLSTDQREALNKQVGNILDQWVNGKEGE